MVHGITGHGIYESEGCEFVYTVTSQAPSYITHRLGLVVSGYKGDLDKGFSSCAAPAFRHSPGISSCMQVYSLPMDHREVAESKGAAEIVSGLVQSQQCRGSRVE